jgi:hypothetical protein
MFEIWCSAHNTLLQSSVSDQGHGRRAQSRTPPNTSLSVCDQSIFRCEWQYIQTTFTTLGFETQYSMLSIEQSLMDINRSPMNDSFPTVGIQRM